MVRGKMAMLKWTVVVCLALVACNNRPAATAVGTESGSNGVEETEQAELPTLQATEQIDPMSIAQGEWVFLESMQISRSEYSVEVINGHIYAPGGLGGGSSINPSNALERYNPAENSWVFQAILPKMRHHASTAVWEDKLYLFGGDPYSGRGPDAWVYDPQTDMWQAITPMPLRVVAGSAITLDDQIFLMGGISHSTADGIFDGSVQRYDPQQDEWEILSMMPVIVNHCALVVIDGEIYVIGGRDASTDYDLVQIYNPVSDSWREGPPLQRARAGHAAVLLDGLIYVVGGERVNSEDFSVLDSVEVFNPATQTWSYGTPLPVALHGLGAESIDGILFVVGGSELANGVANHGYLLAFRP